MELHVLNKHSPPIYSWRSLNPLRTFSIAPVMNKLMQNNIIIFSCLLICMISRIPLSTISKCQLYYIGACLFKIFHSPIGEFLLGFHRQLCRWQQRCPIIFHRQFLFMLFTFNERTQKVSNWFAPNFRIDRIWCRIDKSRGFRSFWRHRSEINTKNTVLIRLQCIWYADTIESWLRSLYGELECMCHICDRCCLCFF